MVNKPYQKVRKNIDLGDFHVVASIGTEERLLLSGKFSDYHAQLIHEVTAKFFYNMSLKFSFSLDVFDYIMRIPIDEWKNLATLINMQPNLTEDQIQAFSEGQWDHPVFLMLNGRHLP